jgi:hypothetical protein
MVMAQNDIQRPRRDQYAMALPSVSTCLVRRGPRFRGDECAFNESSLEKYQKKSPAHKGEAFSFDAWQ